MVKYRDLGLHSAEGSGAGPGLYGTENIIPTYVNTHIFPHLGYRNSAGKIFKSIKREQNKGAVFEWRALTGHRLTRYLQDMTKERELL